MPQLTDEEFNDLSVLLQNISGIKIPENKRYLFSSRLDKRLSQLGLLNYSAYYKFISLSHSKENDLFVNAMTTNLSYFFREKHHFKSTLDHFNNRKDSQFYIGSFGCSTGEEPVSIAITLLESGCSNSDFKIFSSDIDSEVLKFAKTGCYSIDRTLPVDKNLLTKYFTNLGINYQLNKQVSQSIDYSQINLTKGPLPYPSNYFDIVFCRNALIYFSPTTQKLVVDKLSSTIKPGGLLCLGHAELLTDPISTLSFMGQSTYRKKP